MNGACTATAGTNIALVKYWGKREGGLNLPATGSLSLTLDAFGTRTTVAFGAPADRVVLNGRDAGDKFARRVSAFLDLVRSQAGSDARAEVLTENSVPTASGLASSASGFAALAVAASRAAGLSLTPQELSALARRGSGSAARSIFGGFVEMARGERPDGTDAVASPIPGGDGWAVRLVVAVVTDAEKAVGSREGMERTQRSSPYYAAWVETNQRDLAPARAAVVAHDLTTLGAIAERSALRMHASAMAADPGVIYFAPTTLALMQAVRELRASGVGAYFTMDAGPHVKVLCGAADAEQVAARLVRVPGVLRVVTAAPGPAARVVEGAR